MYKMPVEKEINLLWLTIIVLLLCILFQSYSLERQQERIEELEEEVYWLKIVDIIHDTYQDDIDRLDARLDTLESNETGGEP